MTSVARLGPWLLAAVLAVALGIVWNDSRQKDGQIASLNQQLTKTVADADAKYRQLADDANAKLSQITEEANGKIAQANLREISVRVAFRKAILSSGLVATISNTSNQTIAITAEVSRPSTNQSKTFPLTIDMGLGAAIGQQEGWAFVAGDTVTISQPDHKSLTFKAPER